MQEILEKIMAMLKADAGLIAIIPSTQMFTGPVDITVEAQANLLMPQLNIHVVGETVATVPINTRETTIQIDIWSRNSQLEVIQVYEKILSILNYNISDQSTAHLFWMKSNSAVDLYESDRRIFHRAINMEVWSKKP